MATLLQCDQCQRTEPPADALNWLRLDWDGAHLEYVWQASELPALFCGWDCLDAWRHARRAPETD